MQRHNRAPGACNAGKPAAFHPLPATDRIMPSGVYLEGDKVCKNNHLEKITWGRAEGFTIYYYFEWDTETPRVLRRGTPCAFTIGMFRGQLRAEACENPKVAEFLERNPEIFSDAPAVPFSIK